MERLKGEVITLMTIRVQEKVIKASDFIVLAGALSTEYLHAMQVYKRARKERNDSLNRVVQKYRKIYSH